jgi:transcriptional regulator with XRE-family HTH domain
VTIGARIKELRIRRGLTQDQISAKLNMNRANFSHYERDTAVPPSEMLGKIADILNTSTDYLLGRDLVDDQVRTLARDIQDLTIGDQDLLKAMINTMRNRGKEALDK